MGRLKKTAAEKRLSGNPGRRKIEDDPEIQSITDDSTPLGMTSENQIRYWKLYAPYMIKNHRLTDLNYSDLVRLCKFEPALDSMLDFLADTVSSMVQEKKNYHGDVVDLVESTYSKIARNYSATIRTLKADLGLRTDKLKGNPAPQKPKSKFAGLIGSGKK